uniref:Glycylpeptide N-tetradecanoyltransferase n=1 Tax=viral metagenome TaxID=1070528 RepID=A0A6C0HFK0_9ZZZZ
MPINVPPLFIFLSTKINYSLLVYIIIAIIILYILLVAYIKIKLRFWRTQPVFHIYNVLYWLNPPGIINHLLPETENNKYMNHLAIKTYNVADLVDTTSIILDQFCNFVNNFYAFHSFAQRYDSEYRPKKNDIVGYFEGTNHPSYITLYQKPEMLFQKGQLISSLNVMKGGISARAMNICIKGKGPVFPLYYIDNLCVHPESRKAGVAPELIQTLYYNLRKKNSNIKTYLFKREGDLTAIVPLTTFETYCYDIGGRAPRTPTSDEIDSRHVPQMGDTLHASMNVIEIGVPQLALLVEFIKSQQHNFECVILPDITNLANMIKTENISIYGLIAGGSLLSIYVFRNIQFYYNGRRATECILALYSYNKDLFITGFTIALGKVIAKYKVGILLIEDTAQAYGLIANLNVLNVPLLFKSPTAFFMYNYACYSISHRKFMILY